MISAIENHDPVLAGDIVRAHLELSRRRMSEYAAPEGLEVAINY
jgi:DNA-binding GntR family transcriptional regulator